MWELHTARKIFNSHKLVSRPMDVNWILPQTNNHTCGDHSWKFDPQHSELKCNGRLIFRFYDSARS